MSSRIRFVLAAALMLGWSVAPAQEAEILRFNNDFEDNVSVGLWNCPLPMDYDGDGVRDLIRNIILTAFSNKIGDKTP